MFIDSLSHSYMEVPGIEPGIFAMQNNWSSTELYPLVLKKLLCSPTRKMKRKTAAVTGAVFIQPCSLRTVQN